MIEREIRHPIEGDAEAYWRCVFDDEFNRRLYVDVMRFREFKTLRLETTDEVITRAFYFNPPPTPLPKPVEKVLGDMSWVEEATYDRRARRMRVRYVTGRMADKIAIDGEVWCEPRADGAIERVARMRVDARLFVVGPLVQRAILADLDKNLAAIASFTTDFIREKGWSPARTELRRTL
jgi:hypothetical protein